MRSIRRFLWISAVLGCLWSAGCGKTLLQEKDLSGIADVVRGEIEKGSFPGAVVLVGEKDRIVYLEAFGNRCLEPEKEPMEAGTVFDMASLTKPVATAAAVMMLVDRGKIDLEAPVQKYLPEFASGGKQDVRIRHLLTHTSGLPAYTNANTLKEEYGDGCRDAILEKICSLEAMNAPGETFRYSCLGYITLARIVEVVTGEKFDVFVERQLYQPMGMCNTQFTPAQETWGTTAATEVVDGKALRGVVHDPLARLAGGVSGNAGLFSTARDLSVYCRMLLDAGVYKRKRMLSAEAVKWLTQEQDHGRAYGFDVNSSYAWLKGQYAPKEAFCHSGYTGTSIVCDPNSRVYVIILTNRVHPKDAGTTRATRVGIADIVFRACGYEQRVDPNDKER